MLKIFNILLNIFLMFFKKAKVKISTDANEFYILSTVNELSQSSDQNISCGYFWKQKGGSFLYYVSSFI